MTTSQVSAPSFTLAQLTDPHLTSLDNIRISSLLNKRILGYLSWRHSRKRKYRRDVLDILVHDLKNHHPDHIVVTGDLTQIGLPEEFQHARVWLDSLGSPSNVTVIPGNHEAYALRTWDRFLAAWEPYLRSDSDPTQPSALPATFQFPTVRIRGPLAIIGLSSAFPSLPFLAVGKIDEAQLRRFSGLMENLAKRDLFRVVLIHHPPVPDTIKWRKRLTNASALLAVLNQCGAELILHGHAHRWSRSSIQGTAATIPVIGLPAASRHKAKLSDRAGYNLYRITRQSNGWELKVSSYILASSGDKVLFKQEEVLVTHSHPCP